MDKPAWRKLIKAEALRAQQHLLVLPVVMAIVATYILNPSQKVIQEL